MNAPRRIQESTAKQQCHRRRAGRPKARAWLRHLRSHGNRKRSGNDAAEKTALSFEERYGETPAQCGAVHAGNSSALCVTVPCTRQAIGIARRVNVILKKVGGIRRRDTLRHTNYHAWSFDSSAPSAQIASFGLSCALTWANAATCSAPIPACASKLTPRSLSLTINCSNSGH